MPLLSVQSQVLMWKTSSNGTSWMSERWCNFDHYHPKSCRLLWLGGRGLGKAQLAYEIGKFLIQKRTYNDF